MKNSYFRLTIKDVKVEVIGYKTTAIITYWNPFMKKYLKSKGSTRKNPNDKDNPEKASRIAISRAKLNMYLAYETYFAQMAVTVCKKYSKLKSKELDYLTKVIEDKSYVNIMQ